MTIEWLTLLEDKEEIKALSEEKKIIAEKFKLLQTSAPASSSGSGGSSTTMAELLKLKDIYTKIKSRLDLYERANALSRYYRGTDSEDESLRGYENTLLVTQRVMSSFNISYYWKNLSIIAMETFLALVF